MITEQQMRAQHMENTLNWLMKALRERDTQAFDYWLELLIELRRAQKHDEPAVIKMAAHGCCDVD